jgi:outer membrane lipoprotein-sorting protein
VRAATRREAIAGLAGLAALIGARPARAAPIPLPALSAWLNGLRTAQANFTQINADGTLSTGRVHIRRPGRMRFDYDPPDPAAVIAGGGQVAVFDSRSNTPPEQFPLSQTPLSLILAPDIDLSRRAMVTEHRDEGTATSVTARDPDHPERGSIRLVFTADPVMLRQWVITDEVGAETTVILNDFETGMALPPRLFSIRAEMDARGLID